MGGHALGREQLGRITGQAYTGADADERHVSALLDDHAAPHLEGLDLRERHEGGGQAARIADRRGPVESESRGQHPLQLLLAGRCHHGHAGDDPQEGEVEHAMV